MSGSIIRLVCMCLKRFLKTTTATHLTAETATFCVTTSFRVTISPELSSSLQSSRPSPRPQGSPPTGIMRSSVGSSFPGSGSIAWIIRLLLLQEKIREVKLLGHAPETWVLYHIIEEWLPVCIVQNDFLTRASLSWLDQGEPPYWLSQRWPPTWLSQGGLPSWLSGRASFLAMSGRASCLAESVRTFFLAE